MIKPSTGTPMHVEGLMLDEIFDFIEATESRWPVAACVIDYRRHLMAHASGQRKEMPSKRWFGRRWHRAKSASCRLIDTIT